MQNTLHRRPVAAGNLKEMQLHWERPWQPIQTHVICVCSCHSEPNQMLLSDAPVSCVFSVSTCRLLLWEAGPVQPPSKVYDQLPLDLLHKYQYFNMPATANLSLPSHPLNMLKAIAQPGDFVVLKLVSVQNMGHAHIRWRYMLYAQQQTDGKHGHREGFMYCPWPAFSDTLCLLCHVGLLKMHVPGKRQQLTTKRLARRQALHAAKRVIASFCPGIQSR